MGASQQIIANNAMAPAKVNGRTALVDLQHNEPGPLAGALASLASTIHPVLESPKVAADMRTSRCRFYRLSKNALSGHDLFTEVWDFVEEPYAISKLPKAELVKAFEGNSPREVQQKVDLYREQNNFVLTSDWTSRGSL